MKHRGILVILLMALLAVIAAAAPARAASGPEQDHITLNYAGAGGAYDSSLTIHFPKPVSSAIAARIKSTLAQQIATPEKTQGAMANGPQGAFLYCNQFYAFSDSNGTFSFQHACAGTTGPWGFKLSVGLCAIAVSGVREAGMYWTRNGTVEPLQAPHPAEYCGYQYHGNFNPDHDYDFITYRDVFSFVIESGGQTGEADVTISGSFTSAGCPNRIACGP